MVLSVLLSSTSSPPRGLQKDREGRPRNAYRLGHRTTSAMEAPVPPPSGPPPLLSPADTLQLAHQGYLNVTLAPHLQTLYEDLFEEADRFFAHAEGAKTSSYPPSPAGPMFRSDGGYVRVPDEKEYLTLPAHAPPPGPPRRLERLAAEVWHDAAALLHRVLADLARATPALTRCAAADVVWDPVLEGCLDMPRTAGEARSLPTVLRLFRYEPGSGTSEPHRDVGLLTLCVCPEPGLQVYGPAGWVGCGTATVLVGSVLRSLAGDRLRTGLHRVVATPRGRRSVVFALRPSLSRDVGLGRLGGPRDKTVRDVWNMSSNGRFDVNAGPEERRRQKEALRMARGGGSR